jgi:hypothetical protein
MSWKTPGRPIPGRRLSLASLAVLLVAGCASATAIPAPSASVTASRLDDAATGLRAGPTLTLLAGHVLESPDPRFGGISGIETDGSTLWLLSDRAMLWQAQLVLDPETGDLALDGWRAGVVLGDDADRGPLDGEALARGTDGTLLAAFEHDDSVRRLVPTAGGDWRTERLHAGRLIAEAPPNGGLESLARLPDGSLAALSEGARLAPEVAAGAGLAGDRVVPFGYRTGRGFSPVGMASGADGLYVLERSVGLLTGWQSRLTYAEIKALPIEGVLEGHELLRIGAGPLAENHEGVAVLERPGEPALLLVVADDNQSVLQRTLLLVFRHTR